MKLTYIYHSGFAIEGERFMMILDYFKDTKEAFVQQALTSFAGKIYVLASHWHPDHFNPKIMQWKQIRPDIHYILSKDILKKNRQMNFHDAVFLGKGQVWKDDILHVQACGSTDVGGSFLIEAEGKRIFHAGDLNNWHWSEESAPEEVLSCEHRFLREVAFIAKITTRLDLAMFPVDPRQGKDYMLGAEQFVERIYTKVFAPMHFWDQYDKLEAFQPCAQAAGCRFIGWKEKGETIEF